jgi:hypothetical protein
VNYWLFIKISTENIIAPQVNSGVLLGNASEFPRDKRQSSTADVAHHYEKQEKSFTMNEN